MLAMHFKAGSFDDLAALFWRFQPHEIEIVRASPFTPMEIRCGRVKKTARVF